MKIQKLKQATKWNRATERRWQPKTATALHILERINAKLTELLF